MAAQQPDYGIAALARTAALVSAMMRLGPSPLTRLAAEANCTAANAFRILHTLNSLGLVAQNGKRGPWQLGAGWLAIARAADGQNAIPLAASPVMADLSDQVGETVSLVMRDGEQFVVVAVQPDSGVDHPFGKVGERWPLHAGPGLLLLAYAPLSVQQAVIAGRLGRLGPATHTDAAKVSAELPRIRARKWLVTVDAVAEGIVTVTAPVLDRSGSVIAAMNVVSSTVRLGMGRPHTVITPLADAAARLRKVLG